MNRFVPREKKSRYMGVLFYINTMLIMIGLLSYAIIVFQEKKASTNIPDMGSIFRVYVHGGSYTYHPVHPNTVVDPTPLNSTELPESFESRVDIAKYLEANGFKTGVEVGVLRGHYMRDLLRRWPSCERYVLVDVWSPQENYVDGANLEQEKQNENFLATMSKAEPMMEKIEVCRGYSTDCKKYYKPMEFDFIYLDARHDWMGVRVDLEDWWPLLRPGGVIAGDDFLYAKEVRGSDYSVNLDGTRDPKGRAVKGAVLEFFGNEEGQTRKVVTSKESHLPRPPSWFVKK